MPYFGIRHSVFDTRYSVFRTPHPQPLSPKGRREKEAIFVCVCLIFTLLTSNPPLTGLEEFFSYADPAGVTKQNPMRCNHAAEFF